MIDLPIPTSEILEKSQLYKVLQKPWELHALLENDKWVISSLLLADRQTYEADIVQYTFPFNQDLPYPMSHTPHIIHNPREQEYEQCQGVYRKIQQVEAKIGYPGNESIILDVNIQKFMQQPDDYLRFMNQLSAYTNFVSSMETSQQYDYERWGLWHKFFGTFATNVLGRATYLTCSPDMFAILEKHIDGFQDREARLNIKHKPAHIANNIATVHATMDNEAYIHSLTQTTQGDITLYPQLLDAAIEDTKKNIKKTLANQ